MRRANIGCANNRPFRVVPASGQVSENAIESSNKEPCDVLNRHDRRSKNANDASELQPERGSIPVHETDPLPGVADVLTGESADEDVDPARSIARISSVPPALACAPRVNFAAVSRSRAHGVGQSVRACVFRPSDRLPSGCRMPF